jgi:hypothetical protein
MTEILLSLTPLNWIAIGQENKSNLRPRMNLSDYGDTLLNTNSGQNASRHADRA